MPGAAAAQQTEGPATFRVFLRGTALGSVEVNVRRVNGGWTLSGSGHLEPPLDLTTKRLEIRYDGDWHPIELTLDAATRGATISLHTDFADGKAASDLNQSGAVTHKTDPVAPDTLVLPNLFFGSYEALALRLASVPDGGSFKAYIAPQAEITVKQNARSSQRIERAVSRRRSQRFSLRVASAPSTWQEARSARSLKSRWATAATSMVVSSCCSRASSI